MNEKVERLRAITEELATIGFYGDDDAIAREDILNALEALSREQARMFSKARFGLFTEAEEITRAEIKRLAVASGEWGENADAVWHGRNKGDVSMAQEPAKAESNKHR